jgi:predicted  nucleic acid-binding Zn-ribbon protein
MSLKGGIPMNNMHLLMEIQQKYDLNNRCKVTLKDTTPKKMLKKLKFQFEGKTSMYNERKKQLEVIKRNYGDLFEELEELKKQLTKQEFSLYNEAGSDIKLIESLEKKIKTAKIDIQEFEEKSIEILEQDEKLCTMQKDGKIELIKLREEFYNYKEEYNNKVTRANEDLAKTEEAIEKIAKKIPKELLGKYNRIRESKGVAVVKIHGGVCSGCKMKVSAMTIDSIYNGVEIVHCDNCGRILFWDDIKTVK